MENTDDMIKSITGTSDYMKELAKITGNLESVNLDYFIARNNENIANDNVIRSGMKKLDNSETKNFFALSIENNFQHAIVQKKNKRKTKKMDEKFRPKIFIKSPYFKIVKKIEKTCNNLFESYNIDREHPSINQVNEVLKTNPELMEVKNFFDYKLTTDDDIRTLVDIQKATHSIIENYMAPMYDVKATMDKNWNLLSPMFKMNTGFGVSEVKDMLYLFIIAKYRCTITENNKHYMKLFMDVINKTENNNGSPEENNIANMDPARFLELLDNINLDTISEKKSVYEFAIRSKDIIKRITNKKPDDKMEDILKDIQQTLEDINNVKNNIVEEEEDKHEPQPEITENNDILANI